MTSVGDTLKEHACDVPRAALPAQQELAQVRVNLVEIEVVDGSGFDGRVSQVLKRDTAPSRGLALVIAANTPATTETEALRQRSQAE